MIVVELAMVHHEKECFENDYKRWLHFEAENAVHAFQRQEADDFLKLKRQWPKAPAAIAPIIGQSIQGALLLVELWQIIVARLAPQSVGPVPGMDQACQALLAMGFSDKIQHLAEAGWWWATRFLAIQSDKDEAIKAWLRRSGTCDRAAETQQARHKLYDAPDAATARHELYEEAVRQAAFWSGQLKQLHAAEPAKRQAQKAQARCMALKTPGLAACLNNAQKLRGSLEKILKFTEEQFFRARKDHAENERNAQLMPKSSRPEPAKAESPGPNETGQAVEAAIRMELLPKMAAASQARPEPKTSPVLHTAHPGHRPMSHRKKRLAKLAAKEQARMAAPPV